MLNFSKLQTSIYLVSKNAVYKDKRIKNFKFYSILFSTQ